MKKIFIVLYKKYKYILCGFAAGIFMLGVNTVPGNAAEYETILVYPPNVGVFSGQVQQFSAWGRPVGGGAAIDITKEVDWYLEANPLALQKAKGLKFKDVASIDENGLLTTISTWGRLNVSACYPKGCGPNNTVNMSGALSILTGSKYLITPVNTDPNGSVDPATAVKVKRNSKASFTITPQLYYTATTPINDTCGGTFTDNSAIDETWNYTVDPVTKDCTFETTFAEVTYNVTPVNTDPNGSVDPSTPVNVKHNGQTSFTITPQSCYAAATPINDTCGGAFTDNSAIDGTWDYTVNPVTKNCTFETVFVNAGTTYVVTPISVTGGTYPATTDPITASCGSQVDLVFNPTVETDVAVLGASDTCGGTLTNNGGSPVTWTYSIASLDADCAADVVFAAGPA